MPSPIFLIADTLNDAKLCHAAGVLLVPEWPLAYFRPMLTSVGKVFENFVKEVAVLDPYYSSACPKSVFQGHAAFRTLALKLQF